MDILRHANELGAEVRHVADLDRWGRYDADSHTITLWEGLSTVQWRSTLAHECGHAYWRHERGTAREERQADIYAVELLIPPARWGWAISHAHTVSGLAQELHVLPRLVVVAYGIYYDATFCGT